MIGSHSLAWGLACEMSGTRSSFSSQLSDLVQILHIDRDRNIWGVSIIEEMRQPNFDRNRADHFAKARHLEVLHMPDFEHQRTKIFADKPHSAIAQIDSVKMPRSQRFPNWIVWR